MNVDGQDATDPFERHSVRRVLPSPAQDEKESNSEEATSSNEFVIPFSAPLSSFDKHNPSLFLSPTTNSLLNKPNLVQLRWRAHLPPPTPPPPPQSLQRRRRSNASQSSSPLSFLPLLRRLPVFEPVSYRLHTTSTLLLSDDEYVTFTPSIKYTPQAASSSLLIAYHTLLSPSLSATTAVDLATPTTISTTATFTFPTSTTALTIRTESDGISAKAAWRQRLAAAADGGGGVLGAEVGVVGLREQSVWVGWMDEQRDGTSGQRVGVMWRSNGVLEVSARMVRSLQWCPPFSRCYLQATSIHHIPAGPVNPLATALLPPPPSSTSAPASKQLDPLLSPSAQAFLTPSQLSVEVGVGAHLNRQHTIDLGVGWSTLGCYINVAVSSSLSTFSFPVYFTPPTTTPVSSSTLPSLFSLVVGTPVAFCLMYSLLVSPLYQRYTRRRARVKATESADIVAQSQFQSVVERIALQSSTSTYTQPQLTTTTPLPATNQLVIHTAHYGWSQRTAAGGGAVHGGRDVSGVLRFWVRGLRLRLYGGWRKGRMLGFGGEGSDSVVREAWMVGDEWALGVLIVYESGGVMREVWVGECEAVELPSEQHRLVPSDSLRQSGSADVVS